MALSLTPIMICALFKESRDVDNMWLGVKHFLVGTWPKEKHAHNYSDHQYYDENRQLLRCVYVRRCIKARKHLKRWTALTIISVSQTVITRNIYGVLGLTMSFFYYIKESNRIMYWRLFWQLIKLKLTSLKKTSLSLVNCSSYKLADHLYRMNRA